MTTMLESTMPVYHFRAVHRRAVRAGRTDVWQALTTLTLEQLTVTRPLVAIRHPASSPLAGRPLLTDGPVTLFDAEPARYAIGGAVARPWRIDTAKRNVASLREFEQFDEPGWTKYLTDFSLEERETDVLLTTETRGYSTDSHARRVFALYWAAIRIGSSLVRRDILATVARNSETGIVRQP